MGYENDLFVQQPVDNDLVCAICYDVLENPITVCTGEHIFCQPCVDSWTKQQNKNDCPTCRVAMVKEPISSRRLTSKIMALQVRCPEKDDENTDPDEKEDDDSHDGQEPPKKVQRTLTLRSKTIAVTDNNTETTTTALSTVVRPTQCPWTGTLADFVATHKCHECDYRKTACSACNQLVKASKLATHNEKHCPERLVQCTMCQINMAACQLHGHKLFHCPRRAVTCAHCSQVVRSEDLGTYMADPSDATRFIFTGHMQVCPDLCIPCEFSGYGCPAMLKRNEIETHREDCGGVHSQLLLKKIQNMQEDAKWERGTIVWNFSKYHLLELEVAEQVASCYSTFGGLKVGIVPRWLPGDGNIRIGLSVVPPEQGFTVQCDGLRVVIEGQMGSAGRNYSRYDIPTRPGKGTFMASPTLRDGSPLTLDILKVFFGSAETVEITAHFKLLKPNVVVIS